MEIKLLLPSANVHWWTMPCIDWGSRSESRPPCWMSMSGDRLPSKWPRSRPGLLNIINNIGLYYHEYHWRHSDHRGPTIYVVLIGQHTGATLVIGSLWSPCDWFWDDMNDWHETIKTILILLKSDLALALLICQDLFSVLYIERWQSGRNGTLFMSTYHVYSKPDQARCEFFWTNPANQ
jgi:hypothetical protein